MFMFLFQPVRIRLNEGQLHGLPNAITRHFYSYFLTYIARLGRNILGAKLQTLSENNHAITKRYISEAIKRRFLGQRVQIIANVNLLKQAAAGE